MKFRFIRLIQLHPTRSRHVAQLKFFAVQFRFSLW